MRNYRSSRVSPTIALVLASLIGCDVAPATVDDAGAREDAPWVLVVDANDIDAAIDDDAGAHDAGSADDAMPSDAGPEGDAPAATDAGIPSNLTCADALPLSSTRFFREVRSDLGERLVHGDCEGGTVARRSLWYAVTVPPAHRLWIRTWVADSVGPGSFFSGEERILSSCDGAAASCVSVGVPGTNASYTNDTTSAVTRFVAIECPFDWEGGVIVDLPCDVEIYDDPV